jgi:predicted nucleotide-binding protein
MNSAAIRAIVWLIDEAIEIDDIQVALQNITGGDAEDYKAVTTSLRQGAQGIEGKFLEVASVETSNYVEAVRKADEGLRDYLLSNNEEYRRICSLEDEINDTLQTKQRSLEQLWSRRIETEAREAAEEASLRRGSGSVFRRWRVPKSEQLANNYLKGLEELTVLRRKAVDVSTSRKRFELRFRDTDPESKGRLEEVEHTQGALRMTAMESVILPYIRSSITEYDVLQHEESEETPSTLGVKYSPGGSPGIVDHTGLAEEDIAVSKLEEAAPAKSLGAAGPGDRRSVFLVHGRDQRAAKAMREFLRALNLRVVEWEHAVQQTGQPTPYVGDIVFAGMGMADAVIVLSTPDDLVHLRRDLLTDDDSINEQQVLGQARANVIYEAGIADALDSSRTVLVELGKVKSLSDLGGRNVVRFDGGPRSRNRLVSRLRKAGLELDIAGDDWLETGDFSSAIAAARMALAAESQSETTE